MDFTFSPEQAELRRTVRDVAADRCTPARLRSVIASDEGYDADLWRLVAGELGLVGIAVRESSGGVGGTFVDAGVVLEESGRALFPLPLLTSLVAAVALDRGDPDVAASVVPAIAAGDRTAVLVVAPSVINSGGVLTGEARQVLHGQLADLLVVAEPDGLWAVEATSPGVRVVGGPSLDLTRGHASVTFDVPTDARRIGDAAASATAVDLLRVALAVEAVGAARHCLASTIDYLKTRVQFDRPIGSFQAVQHRCAELAVALEAAASTAYYAAWVAADSPAELPIVAPLAKSVCADALYRIAAETIQLHGGIGFTWEHDAHLYFKRATATRLMLGDSHVQRRLVAERAGLLA